MRWNFLKKPSLNNWQKRKSKFQGARVYFWSWRFSWCRFLGEDLDDQFVQQLAEAKGDKAIITDKEFYKAMQKLKDRGTNAVPPKKSASAYIIFGKEVSLWTQFLGSYSILLKMLLFSDTTFSQKRAEILKRNPLAKVTEVVKEIAQSWGILSKEER